MRPELAAQHAALEALADPITPWPADTPARVRTGASWRSFVDAIGPLRGLTMVIGILALHPLRRWFASFKQRRKNRPRSNP